MMLPDRYIVQYVMQNMTIFVAQDGIAGWENNARQLANASENLAGWVENRPGRVTVEFCRGYIRDYPVRASTNNFSFPACIE